MDASTLSGYTNLVMILYAAGVATADSIKRMIAIHHPDVTDAELNTIVDAAQQQLRDVKNLADGDAADPNA